ncbi:MAG: hypothetical protein NC394_07540 [Bacteroides sp.]|nr:hypothetical protein [Bacteroides sp.]
MKEQSPELEEKFGGSAEQRLPSYDEAYLTDVMNVHGLLFEKLAEEKSEYDIFSMIDTYMRCSEIRAKMDKGNWSALNKGYKQLLNSIDFSHCSSAKTAEPSDPPDPILLGWMADIYVLLQWRYNMPSAEISKKLSAHELCRTYYPLHETSHSNACDKLYKKYLS